MQSCVLQGFKTARQPVRTQRLFASSSSCSVTVTAPSHPEILSLFKPPYCPFILSCAVSVHRLLERSSSVTLPNQLHSAHTAFPGPAISPRRRFPCSSTGHPSSRGLHPTARPLLSNVSTCPPDCAFPSTGYAALLTSMCLAHNEGACTHCKEMLDEEMSDYMKIRKKIEG